MTVISSGLVSLVSSVRTYFTDRDVTANVSMGWRERTKQTNQGFGRANRVVFTPSDDNGNGGRIVGTQHPGPRVFGTNTSNKITARALFDWERVVLVSVWAVDTADIHNEEKQIEATETLFEWTIRAVQAGAFNNGVWGNVAWTVDPTEQIFGRELRASLTFRHPMFDTPVDVAFPQGAITQDPSR